MILQGTIVQPATFEVLKPRSYDPELMQVTVTCRVTYGDVFYDKQYTLTQEQTEQRGADDSIIIDALCANNGFTRYVEPVVVEEPPIEEPTTEEPLSTEEPIV